MTTTAIICGPPKGCTCPAVAWYCICEASERGRQVATERNRRKMLR